MMRFQIHDDVAPEALPALVPQRFRERVALVPLGTEPFALILFAGSKDEITLSGVVKRALDDVPAATRLVAVAWGFTVEALAALKERGAVIVVENEFHWTDQGYQ